MAGPLDLAALHDPAAPGEPIVRAPRDDDDVFEPDFELDTNEHKEWLDEWREESDDVDEAADA